MIKSIPKVRKYNPKRVLVTIPVFANQRRGVFVNRVGCVAPHSHVTRFALARDPLWTEQINEPRFGGLLVFSVILACMGFTFVWLRALFASSSEHSSVDCLQIR